MRLTKAQRAFLLETSNPSGDYAADSYPPAKRLYELGLVNRIATASGRSRRSVFVITDAGRQALRNGGSDAA